MVKEHRTLTEMLPEETWKKLKATGTKVVKKKNRMILEEKERDIWIVEKGHAVLMRSSKFSDDRMIFICGEGEILNELSLENGASSIKAKALDECSLLRIPRSEMIELMEADPELTQAVFFSLARKMRRLYHQTGNNNGTYPLEKHLLIKIWKLARDYGRDTEQGRMVDFDISVTLLGNLLGAKRESVSRIISKLREADLIYMDHGRLIVRDMEKVRSLLSPETP